LIPNFNTVEKIRIKQRYIQLLSDLLEEFKDYVIEATRKEFGEPSRFVNLTKIKSIEKIGSKGLQLVTAQFHTELGDINLSIAIKEFSSREEARKNIKLTKLITKRLKTISPKEKKHTRVLTPRVLKQQGSTLIYEGIKGASFKESNLDNINKFQLAGAALAKYHATEVKSADPNRYLFLLKGVLEQLPVPTTRKSKFLKRAADLLETSVSLIDSGTAGFGDFHRENVMFSEFKDVDGEIIIQTWLIDPEYAEEERNADRMEDIATFFLQLGLNYYIKDKNLEKLKNDLKHFFKGYDYYLDMFNLSLNKIYRSKQESSFEFHLGLSGLLEALYSIKRDNLDDQATLDRISLCLKFTNHCWTKGLK
jgi:hypothetical protein